MRILWEVCSYAGTWVHVQYTYHNVCLRHCFARSVAAPHICCMHEQSYMLADVMVSVLHMHGEGGGLASMLLCAWCV